MPGISQRRLPIASRAGLPGKSAGPPNLVKRNSSSCSQYQSEERSTRLRKRASLSRNVENVRAWIAASLTNRSRAGLLASSLVSTSYAPSASALSRRSGSTMPVSTIVGGADAAASRSSVAIPVESGRLRSVKTRSNLALARRSSACASVSATTTLDSGPCASRR